MVGRDGGHKKCARRKDLKNWSRRGGGGVITLTPCVSRYNCCSIKNDFSSLTWLRSTLD